MGILIVIAHIRHLVCTRGGGGKQASRGRVENADRRGCRTAVGKFNGASGAVMSGGCGRAVKTVASEKKTSINGDLKVMSSKPSVRDPEYLQLSQQLNLVSAEPLGTTFAPMAPKWRDFISRATTTERASICYHSRSSQCHT